MISVSTIFALNVDVSISQDDNFARYETVSFNSLESDKFVYKDMYLTGLYGGFTYPVQIKYAVSCSYQSAANNIYFQILYYPPFSSSYSGIKSFNVSASKNNVNEITDLDYKFKRVKFNVTGQDPPKFKQKTYYLDYKQDEIVNLNFDNYTTGAVPKTYLINSNTSNLGFSNNQIYGKFNGVNSSFNVIVSNSFGSDSATFYLKGSEENLQDEFHQQIILDLYKGSPFSFDLSDHFNNRDNTYTSNDLDSFMNLSSSGLLSGVCPQVLLQSQLNRNLIVTRKDFKVYNSSLIFKINDVGNGGFYFTSNSTVNLVRGQQFSYNITTNQPASYDVENYSNFLNFQNGNQISANVPDNINTFTFVIIADHVEFGRIKQNVIVKIIDRENTNTDSNISSDNNINVGNFDDFSNTRFANSNLQKLDSINQNLSSVNNKIDSLNSNQKQSNDYLNKIEQNTRDNANISNNILDAIKGLNLDPDIEVNLDLSTTNQILEDIRDFVKDDTTDVVLNFELNTVKTSDVDVSVITQVLNKTYSKNAPVYVVDMSSLYSSFPDFKLDFNHPFLYSLIQKMRMFFLGAFVLLSLLWFWRLIRTFEI